MLQNYFTIAFRNLKKHRAFALLNIVGLGLSIACCILIFILVRHHLSFDRFHAKVERAAMIVTESRREQVDKMNVTPYPIGAALRQDYAFLEKTAMVSSRGNSLVTLEQEGQAPVKFKEEDARAFAEPELFDILDFPLTQGNIANFREPYTALLTEPLARKYYGTTDVLGKTFKVNTRFHFKIVGVLKDIPANTDLPYQLYCSWATLVSDTTARGMLDNWGGIQGGTQCFVLFREGHTVADLNAAFPAFREKYHRDENERPWFYSAIPLKAAHLDPDYGAGVGTSYLWTLALIGLFLLLTACVNFVNMATAQALNRAREVGVRKTMGSSRGQLFWQFMGETGLIVLLSTVLGLVLAYFGLPYLNQLANTRLDLDFARDFALFGFLGLLMVVLAFFAGTYPGLTLSKFQPVESLKGPMEARQVGGFSLRRLLVGTQFAISQALIIGAVVVTAQMEYMRTADVGFRREGIVELPLPGGTDLSKRVLLQQQLGALSGIESLSLCMQPPASDANWNTVVQLEGRPEEESWIINFKFVDDQYAETFGLQLVAGRNLQRSDTLREYVVNEEVVKKLNLPSPEAIIGRRLTVSGMAHQVVGVVKNFHNHSFRENIQPQVLGCDMGSYDVCALRISLQQTKSTLAAIEATWTGLFPDFYYEYDFTDTRLAGFYEQEGIILSLIRLFAGIAVFIGCLGLYGLAAFMILRKTKEIGIRKTLGASIPGILWLFGKEYARLIVFAFVLAAPLAWWAMQHWLEDYVYRISIGAGIFVLSLLTTFVVAMLTVGIQSVRASLANPVRSLRSE